MRNSSKIDSKFNELSSSNASHDFEKERSSQTTEVVTSIRDLPFKLKKEEASKPIYLIRYE